jgi:acyl-CoA synthetase (AMP-forming)/AMP-acid ligase II
MGVSITHRALDANVRAILATWSLSSADRGVFWLPPFHDMGLGGAILAPFICGFPVALMHPTAFLQRPMRWLELIAETRATITGAPNFAYDLCVERFEAGARDLSSLRVAINGAEHVRAATLEAFTERFQPQGFTPRAFAPGYGLAEAVLFVNASAGGAERFEEPLGCGEPHAGLDLRIVDPATCKEKSPGEIGEIWIAGNGVASGYWNAPAATEAAFAARLAGAPHAGPFLRTGDLGFLRGGALHIAGRTKDMLIVGGRNHFAADLEACIREALVCPAMLRTAALALDHRGGEQLVILQEVARGQDARPIFTAIANALGRVELAAQRIILLPPGALPTTTSGKIARARASERLAANALPILAEQVAAEPRAREI